MKILIVEDEPKTAHSLKTYLEEACDAEIDCAFDGYSGKRFAQQNHYDIILTDVVLPHINGIELCRQLRELHIKVPILMLSALYQPEDKVVGLNAGADDYLSKPFDFQELVARLQALMRRANNTIIAQNKLTFADLTIDLSSLEVWRNNTKIILTPKEFALLEFLVRNPNRVIPKAEILESVWGLNEDINTNVVEVYVNYIRNKVDKNFDQKLIHTHFGIGYILKNKN
ncbi:MAG: response regulator transcription factor [Saprospiraceae bacterium]|nr:response regulator transcription factor [Saprospiraceae bacterium]